MSYFIFLDPIESTYVGDDDTIDYDVRFIKLPGTILEWFKELWSTDDIRPFLHATLNCECPPGLWSIYEEDEDRPEEEPTTQEELFTWLQDNVAVERDVNVNAHSIVIGSTMEFDCEYAFFTAEAVRNNELGQYLQPLVAIEGDEVKATKSTVRLSAYL
jgi:hypothetical protein